MSIIRDLMQGLTATGRHRAADRIPLLEAERDEWKAKAAAAQAKLEWADALVTKVCAEKNVLRVEAARLTAQVEIIIEAHALLEDENDELAARLTEAQQELANRDAIHSPAPAGHGNPVPLPTDPGGKTISTLWGSNGLRPVA